MGKIIEVDAISDAIIETEREIAGDAWGVEDTERDTSGDRSLESLGEGLEGQHEAEDDEPEAEEAEGEEEPEAEGETESQPETGKGEAKPQGETQPEPQGRVPAGKLREANERARAAEAERDTLKAEQEKRAKSLEDRLELALRQIDNLRRAPQQQRVEPPKQETVAEPDIFEDPNGFKKGITDTIQTEVGKVLQTVRANSVATSFEIAHVRHQDAFPKAMEAINRLNPQNPDDRAVVQRIYESPNPGEALVAWHKRNETLTRVGNDPAAYEERIRTETRDALMKDPEFRKALLADLRAEASRGDDGQPRTTTRLPKSLARAAGSNVGARGEVDTDDSDQAVASSAWR